MELHTLPKITKKPLRRLGQGHGSGRGKTAGRGYKGQKVRNTVPLFFEGGALPLRKRLPFLRGKGRNKVIQRKAIGVNVGELSKLPKNSVVDLELLIKENIVDGQIAKKHGVKILGDGNLTTVLTIKLPLTRGAQAKVESAGGSVAQ